MGMQKENLTFCIYLSKRKFGTFPKRLWMEERNYKEASV